MGKQYNTDFFNISIMKAGAEYIVDTQSIESFYFIEDVFNFCITGKLRFSDHGSIIEKGNIWGWRDESVIVTYSGTVKTFKIHKINKHTPSYTLQQKDNVYEFILVTPTYYELHHKQWSRSFDNKKTTDIMDHIMKKMVGSSFYPPTFEASNERIKYFYTGLRSPAENFKYLMERSTGVSKNLPGYVCFENINGFNLCTLPSLMDTSSSRLMDPKDADNFYYWFDNENPHLHNKIFNFEREGIDYGSEIKIGGGYRYGHDIKRKKNFKKHYSYNSGLGKFTDHIYGNIIYPTLDPSIGGQDRYEKTGDFREDFVENIMYNNWWKQYCNQQIINFYVKGHKSRTAGGTEAGSNINVKWPHTEKGKMNKNFTGVYFVKGVTTFFYKEQPPYFHQRVSAIKNAYDGKN
jgi:hypothetical protein